MKLKSVLGRQYSLYIFTSFNVFSHLFASFTLAAPALLTLEQTKD